MKFLALLKNVKTTMLGAAAAAGTVAEIVEPGMLQSWWAWLGLALLGLISKDGDKTSKDVGLETPEASG